MTTMQKYVLGFLFSPDERHVVLITKNKPDWQKGLLNGVGGKIENDESPHEAMVREFKEETGVEIDTWNHFCSMSGIDWECVCYYCKHISCYDVISMTDEWVMIPETKRLPDNIINNLSWLIPLALDRSRGGGERVVIV